MSRYWNIEDNERYISWGAGINSTAIIGLYLLGRLGEKKPEIVFADTGGEHDTTYRYIKDIRHIIGKDAITIISPHSHKEFYSPWVRERKLYDALWEDRIFPHFNGRFCTSDWKVKPLKKYTNGRKRIIGICSDELGRIHNDENIEYPIKDYSRDDCIRIIAEAGLPPPHKTGCWFCPFKNKTQWLHLYDEESDKLHNCCELEKRTNFRYFKKMSLRKQVEKWVIERDLESQQLWMIWEGEN